MNTGAALRTDAARALARVVFDGVSLRTALVDANARTADPRDRALLAASLFASTRWWLRLDAALAQLMEKPLAQKARDIRALLVLGCAQIAVLGLPDYAVVASCVDAARELGQPRMSGLVNALLRRFARERAALDAQLDRDVVTRTAHPHWLIDAIRRDWPHDADAILEANNREAALTLRVNRRRAGVDDLIERFLAAGTAAMPHAELPDAIVLEESTDVTRLPGYAEGHFSVQDGAAQRVADVLDLSRRLARARRLRRTRRQGRARARTRRSRSGCARPRCCAPAARRRKSRAPWPACRCARRRRRNPVDMVGRPPVRSHPARCAVLGDRHHPAPARHQAAPARRRHRPAGSDPKAPAARALAYARAGWTTSLCNLLAAARRERGRARGFPRGLPGCARSRGAAARSASPPAAGVRICRASGGMDGFYYAIVEKPR